MTINILTLISKLDNYVILRASDVFPDIPEGGDVDILVDDRDFAEEKLVQQFLQIKLKNTTCSVVRHAHHTHLDIISDGSFVCRLDLIDSFSFLKKIHVKQSFAPRILANKTNQLHAGYTVYFPSKLDDLLIRYIEYLEYYHEIPTKEKHLFYLMSQCNETLWLELIEHAHRYTKFIHANYQGVVPASQGPRTIVPLRQIQPLLVFLKKTLPRPVKQMLKRIVFFMQSRWTEHK